jgi:hypothetical protein
VVTATDIGNNGHAPEAVQASGRVWHCRHCGTAFASLLLVRRHGPDCSVPWSPQLHRPRRRARPVALLEHPQLNLDPSTLALAVGRALAELETDRAWLKQRLARVDEAITGLQALLSR